MAHSAMAAQVLFQDALVEVMENSPLPIIVHQDGKIVFANRAAYELPGFEVGDYGSAIGMDAYAFYSPQDRERAMQNAEAILAGGRRVDNIRRRVIDRNGKTHVQQGSAAPITWEGRPALEVSFVLVAEDPAIEALDRVLATLTRREREIALLVSRNFTTLNIAASLAVAEMTVRTHLRNIFRKLGVHSRAELVTLMRP